MLQVSYIRDNREQVLERLAVKNFKQPELVSEIIELDDKRRSTQTTLDNTSAEANAAAKQIGEFMRTGKKDEAEALKAKTGAWKEDIKKLKDSEGSDIKVWGSGELVKLLLKHDLVDELWLKIYPVLLGKGKTIFSEGTVPTTLEVTESTVTPSGVIFVNYKRAGEVKTGNMGA